MNTRPGEAAILRELATLRDEMLRRFDRVEEKQDLTNGRVTALETQRAIDFALAERRKEQDVEDAEEAERDSLFNRTAVLTLLAAVVSGLGGSLIAIFFHGG